MQRLDDKRLNEAVQAVRQRCCLQPAAGIILGSGLGGLAEEISNAVRIDYSDLPGFVRATASGHRGQLICGSLDGVIVVAMAGRMHRYEGYRDDQVTFPVRLMASLGAGQLIVSNASGGLNPLLNVGDIVVIADHIDLAKTRSLAPAARPPHQVTGTVTAVADAIQQRILATSALDLYDRTLCQIALQAARAGDFPATLGVYLATLGPTYETRAEYRMMRSFGADVVGMSTAPEVRVAHSLGMRVLGLSVVSNVAHPDAAHRTDHQDVLAAGRAAAWRLRSMVAAALSCAAD